MVDISKVEVVSQYCAWAAEIAHVNDTLLTGRESIWELQEAFYQPCYKNNKSIVL